MIPCHLVYPAPVMASITLRPIEPIGLELQIGLLKESSGLDESFSRDIDSFVEVILIIRQEEEH